jgi:hypothetical protein
MVFLLIFYDVATSFVFERGSIRAASPTFSVLTRSTGMSLERHWPKPDGGDWGADPHGPDLPLGAAFSCRDGTQPTPIFLSRAGLL